MNALILLWVALGSAIGGCLRLALQQLLVLLPLASAPMLATYAANVGGSLLIGALSGAVLSGHLRLNAHHLHFLTTGICGGFTTFSLFSLQAVELIVHGRPISGLAYAFASAAGALAAAALGYWLAARRVDTTPDAG